MLESVFNNKLQALSFKNKAFAEHFRVTASFCLAFNNSDMIYVNSGRERTGVFRETVMKTVIFCDI